MSTTPRALSRPAATDLRPYAILLLVALPWWIAVTCPFINIDDNTYIQLNPHVLAGLTPDSIRWAFTTTQPSYWCPLSWLSLMLDVTLFHDAGPMGFHLTNVLLHIANVMLVYLLLHNLTRSVGKSLLIAALWSIHPLRVESVAWVTERKDVLSAFFGLLALISYVRYTGAMLSPRGSREKHAGAKPYLLALLFYALSLMAKPTLVTLPFLFLLLDFWPLERWRPGNRRKLFLEKLPFLLLALAAGLTTYLIVVVVPHQQSFMLRYPLALRLQNALLCLALSLRDTFYFFRLSVFYPQASFIPAWKTITAALALLAIAAAALVLLKKRLAIGRPLCAGLLWFLIAMLPMLNIVQAGEQSRADRFSYIPSIGLLTALVFAWPKPRDQIPGLFWMSRLRIILPTLVIITLGVFTTLRLALWQDPLLLYLDGIAHTGDNWYLESCVGVIYQEHAEADSSPVQKTADLRQALIHNQRALDLRPASFTHKNLANVLALSNRLPEALEHYRLAYQFDPSDKYVQSNINTILRILHDRGAPQSSLPAPSTNSQHQPNPDNLIPPATQQHLQESQ